MTDDIVTRLREYEAITDNAYVINALVAAADEIERLRQTGHELLQALTEMEKLGMLPKITMRLQETAQAFEEAVRGE